MRVLRLALACVAIALLSSGVVSAKIYKYVDENGVTKISNTPPVDRGSHLVETTEPMEEFADDSAGVEWEAYTDEEPIVADEQASDAPPAMDLEFGEFDFGDIAATEESTGDTILIGDDPKDVMMGQLMGALATVMAMGMAVLAGGALAAMLIGGIFAALFLKLACKIGAPEVPSFRRAYGVFAMQSVAAVGVMATVFTVWPMFIVAEEVTGVAAFAATVQSPVVQGLIGVLPVLLNIAIISRFLEVGPARALWIYVLWILLIAAVSVGLSLAAVAIGVGGAVLGGGAS